MMHYFTMKPFQLENTTQSTTRLAADAYFVRSTVERKYHCSDVFEHVLSAYCGDTNPTCITTAIDRGTEIRDYKDQRAQMGEVMAKRGRR